MDKDPTKEAFFSDMIEMEEEIAIEALNLVEHALQLINSKFYDDGIEILRQAIGLYSQINREEEIQAINVKISELYLIKEKEFREVEAALEETPTLETYEVEPKVSEEIIQEDRISKAEELIKIAEEFINSERFEEALDNYDEAIEIFQDLGKSGEINKLYALIEECYNKKADFLRRIKKTSISTEEKFEESIALSPNQENLKERRIQKYKELKKQETEVSNQAYKLLDQAIKLVKNNQFDSAINLYKEAAELFKKLNWENEVNKIKSTIDQLEREKELYTKELERFKLEKEKAKELETEQKLLMEDYVKERDKQQKVAQMERVKELELQKMEDEYLQLQIANMINEANRMVREYEIAMKKALKEGYLLEKTPYMEIIQIYDKVKNLLIDKGWKDQISIYTTQINLYYEKLEKDKKLREIEAQKLERQKQIDEIHKKKKDDTKLGLKIERLKDIEEMKQKEIEVKDFIKVIDTMIKDAERMAREYEIALRKGHFELECPYPEIINIYQNVRQQLIERGLKDDADIYLTHIQAYKEKLKKDEKLRQIEAQKAEKQKRMEGAYKIEKEIEEIDLKSNKLKKIRDYKKKELEQETFENYLRNVVDKAEKMAHEYELAMKKALKEGKVIESNPYSEIINLYIEIRDKVYARGWGKQAEIYNNQIKIYQEKLEKDKKLRQIEAEKIEKQLEMEEYYSTQKLDQEVRIDQKGLEPSKRKREEGEFEEYIVKKVNKAEKLARDFEISMRKAARDGKVLERNPYSEIIDIYKEIRDKVYARGWGKQAEIYNNQIKIYQEKLDKIQKLKEIEAEKLKKYEDIKELHKIKRQIEPIELKKQKEVDKELKEQETLLDKAMSLIDKAETLNRDYEIKLKVDILSYTSPYDEIISYYNEARKLFLQVGWKEEANRLINTIKFYKDKQNKDEKLRAFEKKKLEESKLEKLPIKTKSEEEILTNQQKIVEYEMKKKEDAKTAEEIFKVINEAERIAQEYEVNIKNGILNFECLYSEVIEKYRKAKASFENLGWFEEANKLTNSINFYKQKLEKDERIRALEKEKVKVKEKEILHQRRLIEKVREEKAELLKQRKESIQIKKEKETTFEIQKNNAFTLMDRAKSELKQRNFEKAIELYKQSENIFTEIKWQEGINMVQDSIMLIRRKKQNFEQKQKIIREREAKKLEIQEKLEEELTKATKLKKSYQEQKRQEFLEVQIQKEREQEISEDAYKLLAQGALLMEKRKYDEAYDNYVKARELFDKISWQREVSRINNELLYNLEREKKKFEILEDISKKKIQEKERMERVMKINAKEKQEHEKRKKKDKIKRLKKEEIELKILSNIEKAKRLIDNYEYNKAVQILTQEIKTMEKEEKLDGIPELNDLIEDVKKQADIPLIVLEKFNETENFEKFKLAYEALDKAQKSITKERYMKTISELEEANYNLKEIEIGYKFLDDIEKKINYYKSELGIKSNEAESEEKYRLTKDEMNKLKERIEARREERKKKVLKLLKKDKN